MNIRDKILQAPDRAPVEVEVPEWGVKVYVRGMTAEQRDRFELAVYFSENNKVPIEKRFHNLRARVVCMCTYDDAGNRIFADSDIDELGEKNAKAISRIYKVAQTVSGMTEGDVDELVGKSEPDRSGVISSDLPKD